MQDLHSKRYMMLKWRGGKSSILPGSWINNAFDNNST